MTVTTRKRHTLQYDNFKVYSGVPRYLTYRSSKTTLAYPGTYSSMTKQPGLVSQCPILYTLLNTLLDKYNMVVVARSIDAPQAAHPIRGTGQREWPTKTLTPLTQQNNPSFPRKPPYRNVSMQRFLLVHMRGGTGWWEWRTNHNPP